ncbi:restriction endonuclease subunit S [Limosilactobacillus reuteri]|uniref:restriction endonuclease subunit S n=1 Tax=Limosilactobacillus reuteri TaxID=1598 RepID=UPI002B05C499|nr:restriction endonuclease subunit S [Limosilactobacillus reuteri]
MDKKPEKLVPEVRFKGFTDDWEQHKLGEISFKVNTKNKENLTLPVLSNSAEYGIVNQEDYFDKKIANRTDNYYIVKHNDFVYNPRISKKAPYGPIRRNTLDTKGLMSPLYYVFRINDGNYIYLDYYFKSSKWYKFMYQNGDSGARSDRFAIKDKIFQMMPINMPNTKEQNKIGQLIQTLQKLIDLQQRKLNQLKRLKRAMLQQLFVDKNCKQPILRFKNFNDNWEERKLSDIANYRNGKAHEQYIDMNGIYTVVNSKFISTNGKVKKFSNKPIELLKKGEIAFVLSDVPNGKALAKAYLIDSDNRYSLNQRIAGITPSSDINSYFLYILMNRNRYFLKFDDGVGQTNLSKKDIEEFKENYPLFDEQQKIANLFSKIQILITLQQNKLTQLTTLKKYLLQKLFI